MAPLPMGVFRLCQRWAFPFPKDQSAAQHRDVPLQNMQSCGPGCFFHLLPASFLWVLQ